MSYGLEFTNDSNVVTVDSEFTRLVVLAKGTYHPTQESGLGSVTSFPRTITSQEPPLVFVRPAGSTGIAGLCLMRVIGSPGAWTGFYVRAYNALTLQPNGSYFACGFSATALASYGMRLWDGSSKLLFDSGTPYARFTRAFQNWTYVKNDSTDQGQSRNYYRVAFNFPVGEYMLINTFSMPMLAYEPYDRQLYCWWDFSGGNLYAIVIGPPGYNPIAFFLPAVFAKL
ncbi:hypothetical protein [Pseudomonas sp. NFACC05-1]|uniref:hypothetical protein n=1 Tax=Pseudomonas sp. NFACC05-1 TaxID=1566241 RepID=UPI0008715254|nr:hypothetical protein [Pseudomonas sp. NFACC05-1]SCW88681.1 hypothetical protein SAMN03159424_03949 [Pseudomonas sp. NFACC05-1]